MWEPKRGFFYTGSNDGVTINPDPLPLDPQTWSWLALRDRRYGRALDWAGRALSTRDDSSAPNSQLPDGTRISGVTFSSASKTSTAPYNGVTVNPRGVWLEGTGQLATALADRNHGSDRARARRLPCQIHSAQVALGAGQTLGQAPLAAAGGVVAASSLIDTGFGFGYFQTQHVDATSWYMMATQQCNPMQHGGLHGSGRALERSPSRSGSGAGVDAHPAKRPTADSGSRVSSFNAATSWSGHIRRR